MDASSDAGNEEVEMFLVLHFDPISTDGKVCVRSKFLLSDTSVVEQLKVIPSREQSNT